MPSSAIPLFFALPSTFATWPLHEYGCPVAFVHPLSKTGFPRGVTVVFGGALCFVTRFVDHSNIRHLRNSCGFVCVFVCYYLFRL